MKFFEVLEDEFDDFLERISRPPRPRIIKYFKILNEKYFRCRFRLTKGAANTIHNRIRVSNGTRTMRNCAIGTMERLLLTLRFYATGSYLLTMADFSGISQTSACRIIFQVSKSIAKLRLLHIQIPQDTVELQKHFFQIAKFPRVAGAIDCTHIKIVSPGGPIVETFKNRKSDRKTEKQWYVPQTKK